MKEKILVLGANGMLGSVVVKYLKNVKFKVIALERKDFSILNNKVSDLEKYITKDVSTIINCAGIVKPRIRKEITKEIFQINGLFPLQLADFVKELEYKNYWIQLIHVSTDCVFTGNSEVNYDKDSFPDAEDVYGLSKIVGEHCKNSAMVLRTSIIGEEKNNKYSLLEWAKSQAGKEVEGWTTHTWSGVTTLQFAKFIGWIIKENQFCVGLHHYSGDPINKYELLKTINDVYKLNLNVKEIEGTPCNRILTPETTVFKFFTPPIKEQLEDLRRFFKKWM